MPESIQGDLIADDQVKIAVVVARFNEFITKHLLDGAADTWTRLGGNAEALTTVWVPGSFELPVTAKKLAESGAYRAVICLGCVIRGETDHYDHVVEQTAKGIKDVGVLTGVPCIFGVLTCDTLEQARARALPEAEGGQDKGREVARAALAVLEALDVADGRLPATP